MGYHHVEFLNLAIQSIAAVISLNHKDHFVFLVTPALLRSIIQRLEFSRMSVSILCKKRRMLSVLPFGMRTG